MCERPMQTGAANPCIDPDGYHSYTAEREATFRKELERQKAESRKPGAIAVGSQSRIGNAADRPDPAGWPGVRNEWTPHARVANNLRAPNHPDAAC